MTVVPGGTTFVPLTLRCASYEHLTAHVLGKPHVQSLVYLTDTGYAQELPDLGTQKATMVLYLLQWLPCKKDGGLAQKTGLKKGDWLVGSKVYSFTYLFRSIKQ